MARFLMAVAAAAALCTASAACASEEDCNLNGQCSAGVCVCAAMWTGPDCGKVNFEAAAAPDGALYRRPDTSSWCAGVVMDDAGSWHAYVAVMSLSCGLNSWQRNSVIVHTSTAPGAPPTGPYPASNDVVIAPAFAHNPKPIRAPDGTYLVFHIGCGNNASNPILNCSGGVTPVMGMEQELELEQGRGRGREEGESDVDGPSCGGGSTSLLSGPTPSGPWANTTILGPAASHGPFISSIDNPSPMFYPNGSVSVMFRSYTRESAPFHSVIGIATAPSWEGPWTPPAAPIFMGLEEDPFMWHQASPDSYHALFHTMGGCKDVGCHAYSRDGVSWTLSATPAYGYAVNFTDGTSTTFSRRERPQLVFDPKTGEPTHLINGVQLPRSQQPAGGQGDYTYSIIVPLARAAR